MEDHGSRGGSDPDCSSSIEIPSGVLTNAICPSRGGLIDDHAVVGQSLAGVVDVVHPKGEMAKGPAGAALLPVPIVGQLDLGHPLLPRRGEEDQSEAPRFVLHPPDFL